MPLQPPLQPTIVQQNEGKIDFKREKPALPKLQIKGGDATNITRTIHEWFQRTSLTLNTWSASAMQLWHNAVAVAKAAHQQWTSMTPSQRALQTGLPSTGHVLPAQLSPNVVVPNAAGHRNMQMNATKNSKCAKEGKKT